MITDATRNGKTYELFIRIVFNCERGRKRGAERDLMINLFLNELNKNNSEPTITAKRQFFKVKQYIENALIKLKKKKRYIDSYNNFSSMSANLNKATASTDLMRIINASLVKIIEIENKSKRSA